jgi:hypothetical protein
MPAEAGIQHTTLDSRFHGNDATVSVQRTFPEPSLTVYGASIRQPTHRRDLAQLSS